MVRVGIIGCGTIGAEVAIFIQQKLAKSCRVEALCDLNAMAMETLAKELGLNRSMCFSNMEELIDSVDYVVEAASAGCSASVVRMALAKGKQTIVLSIGGLLEMDDLDECLAASSAGIYLPSGALAGLDAINAAKLSGIEEVTLVTTKPPQGLVGAPYLDRCGIDVFALEDGATVFDGTAREAMKGFPKNINVAALLSLAGIGADRTRVRICISKTAGTNTHEVKVKSRCGTIMTQTANVPDPGNPKTSYLAALSACALLEKIFAPLKIGV